jgi:menaquinone-dependent protoporphyrinogen oxidase
MNALVTAASLSGATDEIAERIAKGLRDRGIEATVEPPESVDDVTSYDAAVIGSAVYGGRWLEPAIELVDRFAAELAERPVWLFSSGPVGDQRRALIRRLNVEPADVPDLLTAAHARGHRVFGGRLPRGLGRYFPRSLEGDWRDWEAVERWTDEIAQALTQPDG